MSVNANSSTVTANCAAGKFAVGGGGSSSQEEMKGSFPSSNLGAATTSGTASSWTATFAASHGNNRAFVICAS